MTSEVVIEPARPDDLAACAAVVNDYIDETPWLPRVQERAEIEAVFAPELLEKRRILVVRQRGEVAGYMSIDPSVSVVTAIYLRAGMRGSGVGARMLDAAKRMMPQGFELSVFEPNADALRFYARQGLVEVPERRNESTEEGIATLTMRWSGHAQ